MKKNWISILEKQPEKEGYYKVQYKNGTEDEKWFRIRPSKNIKGFLTMDEVIHWKP